MNNEKQYKIAYLILHIFIFISFIGFLYFSYFTAKELLVLRNITPENHANKFYFWEINDCNNLSSYQNTYYLQEFWSENEWKLTEEQKNEIIKKCNDRILERSENILLADFKYNFIKYSLASLFFFILFFYWVLQNLFMYKKFACKK